ncbi:glutathione S-transferase [Chytriomyces sp. MP71]|nr:glutathione S-transferase [Chytriomyces sp. MP71]
MRLFKEEPKWTPVNRELPTTDKNAYRVAYLKELNSVGKIYTYPNNPRTARALIAARYNGQHIEIVPVEPSVTNATREYLHKFPLGDIPAFEAIDGFTVTGANAIAQYVASAKVGSPLMGGNVKEAARVQQFVALVDGELAPAQAAWLFPLLGWIQKDETATKKAILDTKRVMTALNEHLRHNTYLVGQAVTLADITAVVVLLNFYRMVFDEQFRNEFKSVTRWFLTCVNQEEFKDVLGDVILA